MNPAEAYILKQNQPFKDILLQLQSVIEAVAPEAELLYKWRIPFYFNNSIALCFLNQSKGYVDLGFWHHEKMERFKDFFVDTNRKTVRSLRYKSVNDINDEVLIYVIEQQLKINTNPFKLIAKSKRK